MKSEFAIKVVMMFFIAVGAVNLAFAEDENVGGGALQASAAKHDVRSVRVCEESFSLGERTFDRGWEFRLADSPIFFTKVGLRINDNGITRVLAESNGWRAVVIPHDWMIEMPVVRNGRNGFRAVGRNYPANSIGWYRKKFFVTNVASAPRPQVYLQFDGIYRDAQFWVNGIYLGRNDSGYIGCRFDVSDLIEYGAENSVVVRVNATVTEGWWYEGAGIYRHVKLIVKKPSHIKPDGILFRTLSITGGTAVVSAEAEIVGEGRVVFELDGVPFEKTLVVKDAKLWSPDSPNLHKLTARLYEKPNASKTTPLLLDETSIAVGIRQVRFDAQRGLLVNGIPTKVKGVCCHGDMAGVGVAIPDALHDYRARCLKGMGVNANRACHNPPTPEFLDACDRQGILVMDETRVFSSSEEGLSQLRRLILRDRNHACLAAFSIGNEEHNVQNLPIGARMAVRMRDLSHALAPDVAVTYGGNNGANDKGVNPIVDVRGVNYVRIGSSDKENSRIFDAPDRYHAAHPDQPIWGSEEASALSTRGSNEDWGKDAVQKMRDGDTVENNIRFPWAATAEQLVNYIHEREWFTGCFCWTGFDYRGESRWPATINNFGIMDLCGFPKASYWYYKANWTDEDVLNVWPNWAVGVTNLWVDTNCETVELFVNGRSIGKKAGDKLHHLRFPVIYEYGTVEARGERAGRAVKFRMKTPMPAATLALTADRTVLKADGADATVINIQALDALGDAASDCNDYVFFSCTGAGEIIGVGNGDPLSHEDDICPIEFKGVRGIGGVTKVPVRNWKRRLFNGKCQVIVRAGDKCGTLTICAKFGSSSASLSILVK